MLKVYQPDAPCTDTYLRLVQGDTGVVLMACDQNGVELPAGRILKVGPDGVMLFHNMHASIGIQRAPDGRVRMT